MIAAGIILMIVGIGLTILGVALNDDLEYRIYHAISTGSTTAPGTIWIVLGAIIAVVGLVLLIVGIARSSSKKNNITYVNAPNGYNGYNAYNPQAYQQQNYQQPAGYTQANGYNGYQPQNTQSAPNPAVNRKPQVQATKFCANCGSAMPEGSMFCGKCGAPMQSQSNDAQNNQ